MATLIATEHGQQPPFISGLLPEFHQEHYEAPKDVKGLSLLKSVLEDPSNTPMRIGTTMLKGAFIATFIRGFMNYSKDGEKKIFYDRAKLNPTYINISIQTFLTIYESTFRIWSTGRINMVSTQ